MGFCYPIQTPCLKPKLKNQKKRDRSTRGLMRRSVSGSYRPGSLIFGFLSELRGFRQRLEIMLSPHLGVASDDACSCPLWIRAVQSRRTIRPHVFQYVSPPVIYGVMLSRLRHSGS